jgi:hypothetical protein
VSAGNPRTPRYRVEPSATSTKFSEKEQTGFMRGSWWRVAGLPIGETVAYVPDETTARIIAEALTDAEIHGWTEAR